jgi:hypothetical protein
MNVYIDKYVDILVGKDQFGCMYVDTDKSICTLGDRQVRSENISHE